MTIDPIGSISSSLPPMMDGIKSNEGAAISIPGSEGSGGNAVGEASGPSFGQMLSNAISEVNATQVKAGNMTAQFAAGAPLDIHQVMIASQEASVSLNLAMQVRNKIVDAYTELMHVSV